MSAPGLVPTVYMRVKDGVLEQWYTDRVGAIAVWSPQQHQGEWRALGRIVPIAAPASPQPQYDPDL